MSDPYSTPESDLSVKQASKKLPWLWTIYNGYMVFSLITTCILVLTGKSWQMFYGMANANPAPGVPAESFAYGIMIFSYVFVLILIAIGYLLVWRVNCRNLWALCVFAIYMIIWFLLGAYSLVTVFDIPGYEVTFLDYFTNIVSQLWTLVLLIWPIWAWRKYKYVT